MAAARRGAPGQQHGATAGSRKVRIAAQPERSRGAGVPRRRAWTRPVKTTPSGMIAPHSAAPPGAHGRERAEPARSATLPTKQSQNATVERRGARVQQPFREVRVDGERESGADPQARATQPRPCRRRPRVPRVRSRSRRGRARREPRSTAARAGTTVREPRGKRGRVEGEHCKRDGAAFDCLEEQPPVGRLHDRRARSTRADAGRGAGATAALSTGRPRRA